MTDTPTAVTTEDFFTGFLDKTKSIANFTLAVTVGQTYSFAFIGIGQNPLQEFEVNVTEFIYKIPEDDNSDPLIYLDSGATPAWTEFKIKATSSGIFNFEVEAIDSFGQYAFKVTEGLQNDFNTLMGAGALYHPGAWGPGGGESTTLTYGFRATPPSYQLEDYDFNTFSMLTAKQMDAFNATLATWSEVSNVMFQLVNPGGYTDDATILVGNYIGNSEDAGGAFAALPENQGDRSSESIEGDVWINLNAFGLNAGDRDDSLLPGTYSYFVTMHEIGHALGLNHPGPYDAEFGVEIAYKNDAKFFQDSGQYTIMSYFDGSNTGQSPGLWYGSSNPQLFDILAIQDKYGPNMQTRSGDTVYGFGSNAGTMYDFTFNSAPQFSIWDGGGIDTLDASEFSQNQTIDLNPGTFSSIGGQTFNISIAFNVLIENAVGGSGDDVIFGNTSGNHIQGGAGNDRIKGGAGSNLLDGGDGFDTALYTGGRSMYRVEVGQDGYVVYSDNLSGGGTDRLINIEAFSFGSTALFAKSALDETLAFGAMYNAMFNRGADADGLRYWTDSYFDANQSEAVVALGFTQAKEAGTDELTNTQFVNRLYEYALDRDADESGFDFWMQALNSSTANRGDVLLGFVQSSEFTVNKLDLVSVQVSHLGDIWT